MRAVWCLLAVLASGAAAASDPQPNTLSPDAAARGEVLLFDGESTFGWTIDGTAAVKDGWLVLGGDKETTATSTAELPASAVFLQTNSPDNRVSLGDGEEPQKVAPGAAVGLKRQPLKPTRVRLTVPAGKTCGFRDVRAQIGGTTPLFNGKDLTGWTVFEGDPKRKASKFEVTKDGELHVTNGPGDLQTAGKYADFVVQFECKTNGKGLNSGMFFRCIPDQYQNGYEAQVQNLYLGEDRTKPIDFGTGAIYRRVPSRKVVSNDGEWFTMTVAAKGNHIRTWVNGYPTVDWTDDRPADDNPRKGCRTAAGHLSLQGHDPTTDLLFRNLRAAEIGK